MDPRGVLRRVIVCALLLFALAVSAVGSADAPPDRRGVDTAVTLTSPPGLAVEARLGVRPALLSRDWVEHRVLKARPWLGFAVPVGLGMLLAAGIVTLLGPTAGRRPTLWCRWSVSLRAPPTLLLS